MAPELVLLVGLQAAGKSTFYRTHLAGSHDWVEFDGTSQLLLTINGHGTVDDNFIDLPGDPYYAMGTRGYDPKTQTWAIWWLTRNSTS